VGGPNSENTQREIAILSPAPKQQLASNML
jgi:hypothetical protein